LERLYATVQVPAPQTSGRGSQLRVRWRTLRSDDRGATWQQLDERQVDFDSDTFALAADPGNPDRIFALESAYAARVSTDGGQTWAGLPPLPTRTTIADLALGVDGRHLYAATYNGVFRLPLQP
jgi:hypothetical protein